MSNVHIHTEHKTEGNNVVVRPRARGQQVVGGMRIPDWLDGTWTGPEMEGVGHRRWQEEGALRGGKCEWRRHKG